MKQQQDLAIFGGDRFDPMAYSRSKLISLRFKVHAGKPFVVSRL